MNSFADLGLFSFYVDGHHECCGIRKVESLKRKLAHLDAWITGQRKDQSPDTRQTDPEVQIDTEFSIAENTLFKVSSIALILTSWCLSESHKIDCYRNVCCISTSSG